MLNNKAPSEAPNMSKKAESLNCFTLSGDNASGRRLAAKSRIQDSVSMLTLSETTSLGEGAEGERPTFSLVINGHSLVHALTPGLELLFLGVAEHCSCKPKNFYFSLV